VSLFVCHNGIPVRDIAVCSYFTYCLLNFPRLDSSIHWPAWVANKTNYLTGIGLVKVSTSSIPTHKSQTTNKKRREAVVNRQSVIKVIPVCVKENSQVTAIPVCVHS
jgi:hypothetical protein